MSGHEKSYNADITVDLAVPTADSAANTATPDVVGNKSDTTSGNSVVSLVKLGSANNTTFHTVPGADSVANSAMRDVVGNKTDTTSGNSIIALAKSIKAKTDNLPTDPADESNILAKLANPAQNSGDDADMRDVIGRKTDDEDGNSIYSKLYILNNHAHAIQYCLPTLAGGVTVTASASAWTLGNFVTIVATNAINAPFDIHQVHIGTFTTNDVCQLELWAGANGAETLISQMRFSRASNTNPGSILPVVTPLLAANTQVKAKLASAAGSSACTFSVMYHKY